MRRFWGRGDSNNLKFSRDDEQILALNYENLCDGDYLVRLFASDPSKDDNTQGSGESKISQAENNNSVQDLAEDIIVFGDEVDIGKQFYKKRLQKEMNSTLKFGDPLAGQINRQVLVFEHMTNVIMNRLSVKYPLVSIPQATTSNIPSLNPHLPLSTLALGCCLSMVEGDNVDSAVTCAAVKPILHSLIQFFNPEMWSNPSHALIISYDQTKFLRKIFLQCLNKIHMIDKIDLASWHRRKFQDSTTSILYGIYGYLILGLLGGTSSDILVAVHYLMLLMITAEEKVENMLSKLKDMLSSINNAHTACSNVIPGRSKTSVGRIPSIKSKPRPKLANKNDGSISPELKFLEDDSMERHQSNELQYRAPNTISFQKHLPVKDLKEKSATPIARIMEHQKDTIGKGKLNATKAKGPEGKMLYEFLEKGGIAMDVIANNQTVVIANHVMVEPTVSRSKSNNRDAEYLGNKCTTRISPRTNYKKIEKEIKDCLQKSLRLPKIILDVLNDYCTIIDGNLSTKRSNSVNGTKGCGGSRGFSTYVWSCGQNSYGELGLGDVNVRKSFTKINSLDDKTIISIGAGNEHSLFVTKDGKLLTAGYNENGQCGIGSTQQVRQPAIVQALEDEEIQQVFVFNGCEHTIALTRDGKIYSFGYNYRGQLGLGSTNSESLPRPVRAIMSRRVILAACSYHHTVFLCHDGTLFSCGRNDSGQLGHGDTADKKTPQAILSAPKNVASISCGQFHTVASTTQGIVYVCGKNDYGQLGMESSNHVKVFSKLPIGSEVDSVIQVCCGYYHTLVVTSAGVVAGFGRNDYGQLGLGHSLPKVFQCSIISSLRDKGVTMLSAGCYHSIAVTMNGMLYVFGRNNHGQLATGDLEERHTPHPVDDFVGQKILSVAAGFYHTLVLTGEGSFSQKDVNAMPSLPSHVVKIDNGFDSSHVSENDPKLLASMLRKDLELLCSYDIPDRQSTSVELSLDLMSSISCRELFTIFVKNISNFDQKDHALMQLQGGDFELKESSLSIVLKSALSIIYVTWEIISSNSHINLPLSVDDAMALLRKLLPILSRIFRFHLSSIKRYFGGHCLQLLSAGSVDIISLLSNERMPFTDRIINFLTNDEGGENKSRSSSIPSLISYIRDILLHVYYNCQIKESIRSDSDSLTTGICELLINAKEIFFDDTGVYLSHLTGIVNKIKFIGDIDCVESSHHLKLLIALGRVFQSPEDAIILFHSHPKDGILMFRYLLNIYNFFSKINVEKRLRGSIVSTRSVEVRRVSTVLEQTIYNMLKCAIPILLQRSESGAYDDRLGSPCEIILEMIKDAEDLLDLIMTKSYSDETLGLLRFGTIMPSILPTTLLYAIAAAKRGNMIPGIMDSLKCLIEKLQGICRCELQHHQIKSMMDRKNSDVSNVSMQDPFREEELSDCFGEEFLYLKREQNSISWWFRLLKISISLLSKSSLKSLNLLMETPCDIDEEQFHSLYTHPLWNIFCFRLPEVLVRRESDFSHRLENFTIQNTQSYYQQREYFKQQDAMYRMIVSSQLRNESGPLLEKFESCFYDTLLVLSSPAASHRAAFQIVVDSTKAIYSKRSSLVLNGGGKSWNQIMTIIASITVEICLFLCTLEHSFSVAVALPTPKSGRSLWRKAVLLIVCLKRWRDYSNRKLVFVRSYVGDFINKTLKILTNGFQTVPNISEVSNCIRQFYSGLCNKSKKVEWLDIGINFTRSYLDQIWPVTLKSDILVAAAHYLRENYTNEKSDFSGSPLFPCYSLETFVPLKNTLDSFIDHLISMVEKCFGPSFGYTLIELQYLTNVAKVLESLLCMPLLNNAVTKMQFLSFKSSTRLIIVLFEKYRHWSNTGEERTHIKRGASVRERSIASKKALFALLSYLQSIVVYCSDNPIEHHPNLVFQAMTSCNTLLSYLQTSRIEESLTNSEDSAFCNFGDNTSNTQKTATKDSSKKRCQDLISKPMEFSRMCEGIAIQGEKLLNNCKGMDYSIATWVLITSRTAGSSKSSFLLGKVSHNEVWPLVLLKNDGKLELVYGHNNENEKTTSETSIPLFTWTHISIVVEQKKIKLFINGMLDCQVNTNKSNSRAILFPLIIGSCPASVRTRVNNVKDGFDGMLAQCKYYSRALSPIHVKVIFDHGPPETTDVSAKIIYQVVATLKILFFKINASDMHAELQDTAELAQLVFVTDSNRRNRYAALDLLRVILTHDALTSLKISGVRYGFRSIEHVQRRSIFETFLAPKGSSFREYFVFYFIRMAGVNWLQHYVPLDHLYNMDPTEGFRGTDELQDIVSFTPSCCFNKTLLEKLRGNSRVVTPTSTQFGDRLSAQDEPFGEVSYHVISVLFHLAEIDSWRSAIEGVVRNILLGYIGEINNLSVVPSRLMAIDMFGVALLVGGISSGAYLGSVVSNVFDDDIGIIIQTNNTINGATIFSRVPLASSFARAIKVRLSDIVYEDHCTDRRLFPVIANLQDLILTILESLSSFVLILSKDFLSINYSDSNFLSKSLLRCMRPVEIFIFLKLYKTVHQLIISSTGERVISRLENCDNLMKVLKYFSTSTLEIVSGVETSQVEDLTNSSSSNFAALWFTNMKYLGSVPEKIVYGRFPSEQDDRYFLEFLQKHLGLHLDPEIKEEFGTVGQWFAAISLLSVNKLVGTDEASQHACSKFSMSDRSAIGRLQQCTGHDILLTDLDCGNALRLFYHIRRDLILSVRSLITSAFSRSPVITTSLLENNLSQDFVLWSSLAPVTSHEDDWVDTKNLKDIFSTSPWSIISNRMVSGTSASDVTHMIVGAIKFSLSSLLQPLYYKTKDNLLVRTDFFNSLLKTLYYWIEFNSVCKDGDGFVSIGHIVLKGLLPTLLPGYENDGLELKILQICVFSARKLSLSLIAKPMDSSENNFDTSNLKLLLDVVRGMHFALIRARAQEQVMKYKSHNFNSVSHLAYNLTQLVSSLEFIQRRVSLIDHSAIGKLVTSVNSQVSSRSYTHLMMAKLQSIETCAPKLISVRSYSIDVDLVNCAMSIQTGDNLEIVRMLSTAFPILLDNIVVEVALGVNTGSGVNTDIVFETVYCGSCHRILQSGLMPDSNYHIRCRVYFGSVPLSWSNSVEFKTEKGLLFSFDPLKCGSDIVLSDDGLTASYAGDDTWSTVLGSRSFSSGVTTWEIRVNQSATAYIFIGVATSAADLNTFLGGCMNGWGFIGEQALYHNREKVKVYGEPFTTGDLIGVTLDLNVGTLSFTKNRKPLGVAFEKIYGDLYPAVAFYNVGQELQISCDGFKTSCAHEPIPISPSRLSMDDVSLLTELILSLRSKAALSHRLAVMVAEHCNQWCTTVYVRCRAVSRKELFLATESPLLKRFNLVVGERVRTFYGISEVAGTAYNRVWFRVNPAGEVWFFTNQQILEGKSKKLFSRCSYTDSTIHHTTSIKDLPSSGGFIVSGKSSDNLYVATYDAATVIDLLDPSKWSEEMDVILLGFLMKQSEAAGVEPWKISSDQLFENFRFLQQQLTRIVLSHQELTQKWGIAGPKRKAVIARLGLLRLLNQMLDMYLPFLISDNSSHAFETNKPTISDDFIPSIETFEVKETKGVNQNIYCQYISGAAYNRPKTMLESNFCPWPSNIFSWDDLSNNITDTQDMWFGPLHSIRKLIFTQTKICHFLEVLKKTSTKPAKTEDDYDYPENLPHVKINRLKAFRAREASELMHVPGNDLLSFSMFCQLWFELRQYNSERLRISYTHPMDDGQSRTFKIKFEGEGVDDYGGPYREVFQQICTELQLLEPTKGSDNLSDMVLTMAPSLSFSSTYFRGHDHVSSKPRCFLPLLIPTPNWAAEIECQERYKFMFDPSIQSEMKLELCRFMGQIVGIAIRSKITLDLAFPSFIWKCIVNEKLSEHDLASFDQAGYNLVARLARLRQIWLRSCSLGQDLFPSSTVEFATLELSEEVSILQELTWSFMGTDGHIVDLIPNGRNIQVRIEELDKFLSIYVESRFRENKFAIQMFRHGLISIIPESAISLLTWDEFQAIVCGSKVIDIDRLRENTEYDDDVSQDDPHIVYFWEVLNEFTEQEKSAFLRFVWARPSLPPKGVDFTQKMRILSATTDETSNSTFDNILPKAHTCFFSINLPKYSSKKIMAEKLRYAILNCTEMDGDFRTTDADIPGWSSALAGSISGANVTLQSSQSVELFHVHQSLE